MSEKFQLKGGISEVSSDIPKLSEMANTNEVKDGVC